MHDERDSDMMTSFLPPVFRLAVFAGLCLLLTACEKSAESPKETATPAAEKQAATSPAFAERIAGEVEVALDDEEKKALMGIARKTLDLWVREKKVFQPQDVPESLKKKTVNSAWGTLYLDGDWRGCVSSMKKNIVDATVQAVINTAKDRRFTNPTPENVNKFRLVLEYPGPKTLIREKNPETIGKQLVPGVHGIYMESKTGRRAFFLPYVFVKKVRSTDTWLKRLARKAGIGNADWRSPEVGVYRFDSIAFMEAEPGGEVVDLYRYKPTRKAFGAEDVENGFEQARRWVTGNWDDQKKRYLMSVDDRQEPLEKSYDWNAHLDAVAMLGHSTEVLRNLGLADWSAKGWRAWLDQIAPSEGKKGNKPDEKKQALKAMDKLLSAEKPDWSQLFAVSRVLGLSGMAAGGRDLAARLFQAMEKGFSEDGRWLDNPKDQCEALWAATLLLGKNYRSEKLGKLKKAAAQCSADAPYALVASGTLLELAPQDVEIADIVKKHLAAAMQRQVSAEEAQTLDLVGAARFGDDPTPSTLETALLLWGLAMSYPLAVTDVTLLTEWENAARDAGYWLLQQQFTEQSGFYLKNWRLYKGSFRDDLVANHASLRSCVVPVMAFLALKKHYLGDWDAFWKQQQG